MGTVKWVGRSRLLVPSVPVRTINWFNNLIHTEIHRKREWYNHENTQIFLQDHPRKHQSPQKRQWVGNPAHEGVLWWLRIRYSRVWRECFVPSSFPNADRWWMTLGECWRQHLRFLRHSRWFRRFSAERRILLQSEVCLVTWSSWFVPLLTLESILTSGIFHKQKIKEWWLLPSSQTCVVSLKESRIGYFECSLVSLVVC